MHNRQEGGVPYLQFDNNRIQDCADLRAIGLDPSCRVPLSAYSPDLNRAIEHTFGWLKDEVRGWMYKEIQHGRFPTAAGFASATHTIFNTRRTEWVAADVIGLPQLWEILDHDEGQNFQSSDGHFLVGSGGDWTKKTHS